MTRDVYDQHEAAFPNVSAYVVALDGKRVATIAFKFGNAVTVYLHWLGEPMVRDQARGGGYDRQSAALSSAARKLAVPEPGDCLLESNHREHWLEAYARAAGWHYDPVRATFINAHLGGGGVGRDAYSWAEAYAINHEDLTWKRFRDALTPDDGAGWNNRLRKAGFDVWQAV